MFLRVVRSLLPIVFSVVAVSAQAELNGTWEFEKSTSPFLSPKTFQEVVAIKQNGSEIIIRSRMRRYKVDKVGNAKLQFDIEHEQTYFSDKRGEINKSHEGNEIYSHTEWKKDELVITYFSAAVTEKKKQKLGTVQYSISKDRNQLYVSKQGKPSGGVSFGAEDYLKDGNMLGVLFVAMSLSNRKDTFKLVSK